MVVESLQHCRQEQGLVIYARCIMSNHVHLIISAKGNNVSDILRNFKKFTDKKIVAAIRPILPGGGCPGLILSRVSSHLNAGI